MAVHEKNRKIVAAVRKCATLVLAALWAAPFIHHGSTKRAVPDMTGAVCVAGGEIDGGAGRPALPKGRTNGIPVGRDVPVAPAAATSASVASAAAASPEPATTADGRFRVAVRPAANDLARPDGVAPFDRWRRRGAADDAFRLAPSGGWFRLPDGFSDGVTVFSRGEIRPNARTPYFPPVFADRVSLLPQARWHLLGAGAAESGLWHCLTPSNSLLVGWANAALGRNSSAPTNAVAELFRDGRFVYHYADRAVEHSPVLPFDWDGDGLENTVDPDPRVAGPDAHGTDAAWYLSVCTCHGVDAGLGLSVSFGRDAVVFEEAYVDAPGVWWPRRSTRTTLSVSANGGPTGGRLALTAKGLERLALVACGPLALPPSPELAARETYSAEFLCEAGTESAAANDVEVEGTFVENGTGRTFTSRAALTVVRVEVRATVDPPDTSAGRLNRHTFGVCERIDLVQSPTSPMIVWTDVDSDVRQSGGSVRYGIPARVCENPLRAECAGTTYVPCLTVLAPQSVSAVFAEEISWESVVMYGAGMGQAGEIGMLLDLYVHPMNVSFTGIQIQEVPSFTYDASGYFLNRYFAGGFGHTGGLWGPVLVTGLM